MASDLVTLSDLCDSVGVQVDPDDHTDAIYIGLEHVSSGRLVRAGGGVAGDVQSAKYVFQPGDVLYGKLRPYLDKAVVADVHGICTTELLVLRPRQSIDPRFLVAVLHSPPFLEHAIAGTTGVQHPRTSWQHIATFPVPRFDPDEQTGIAAVLWRVHDAIAANDAVVQCGRDLKRVAMRVLFTRGLRNEQQREAQIGLTPTSWKVDHLGAHHAVVSGGTPSRGNPEYWSGGTIPWVRTAEVDYTVINETQEHITPLGLEKSAAKLLPPGTLLMAMYGQGVTRGKVAMLGVDAACNQACAAIAPTDGAVQPKYLYHFLAWRYEEIRALAHGGQQQNLNLDIVRDLWVAHPRSSEEQEEIVGVLDALDRKIDLHHRRRDVLEQLFGSLLRSFLDGEINVDDVDISALWAEVPGAAEALP